LGFKPACQKKGGETRKKGDMEWKEKVGPSGEKLRNDPEDHIRMVNERGEGDKTGRRRTTSDVKRKKTLCPPERRGEGNRQACTGGIK